MIEDIKLTENFTIYELTKTTHADLQDLNRMLTDEQVVKLGKVAELCEQARAVLTKAAGYEVPLRVNSGYRCKALNERVGSSERSQHLLCEAVDFVPLRMDLADAFRELWRHMRGGDLKVGQLIYETAERSYGDVSWIHLSLGEPYRDQSRCQQALRMEHGKYRLITVGVA